MYIFSFFYSIDPLYIMLMLPAIIISLIAQGYVKSTFAKYSQVRSRSGMTGREAAERLLRANGISDVKVERVEGFLADHYDPREKVLRLSPDVYENDSLSALGVAAHEAGHAIQHKFKYAPLVLRSTLVPATIVSNIATFLIMISGGVFIGYQMSGMLPILYIAAVGFAIAFLFQLVTLPVEFNASKRAVVALKESGIVTQEEASHCSAVLNAAAMTYVAAAIAALMSLIWIILRIAAARRDD